MKNAINFGLTLTDPTAGLSCGISAESDGAFLALTLTASKTFRTVKGAAAWLAKRGYSPRGERLPR